MTSNKHDCNLIILLLTDRVSSSASSILCSQWSDDADADDESCVVRAENGVTTTGPVQKGRSFEQPVLRDIVAFYQFFFFAYGHRLH